MIIFLIGYMGSGKSTIGEILASRIDYIHVDMDDLLEKEEDRSIAEIFQKEGEDYFRKKEAQILRSIDTSQNIVVSTGGGTPCFYKGMKYMNENGLTIWIRASIKNTIIRIYGDESRPLLAKKTKKEVYNTIRTMMKERYPIYAQSRISIRSVGGPEKIADKLCTKKAILSLKSL